MDVKAYWKRFEDETKDTFRQYFDDFTSRYAGNKALLTRKDDASPYEAVTYAELRAEVYALARWFRSKGLVSGDRVAILSENRPEWCVAYFAVAVSGLVVVPLDAALDAEGLCNNLQAARCAALVYSERHDPKLPALMEKAALKALVRIGDASAGIPAAAEGAKSFSPFRAAIEADARDELPPDCGPDDVAVVFYTSGTTGVAKGIVLTHKGILANVNASITALHVTEKDIFISILPLHHTYAATCTFLSPLSVGGRIVFAEKLIPTVILRHLRDARVSFVIGVPLIFDKIKNGVESELRKLKGAKGVLVRSLVKLCNWSAKRLGLALGKPLMRSLRAKAGLDTIRLIVSGGGPLAGETSDFYDALGLPLVQGYGMSENGPLISVNLPGYRDNRSVGIPVRDTDVRIGEAGRDGIGEIQVRSPSLMKEYLDNPEATAKAFTDDHWLKTGDLGYINRKGFIFITGRSKSLIVTEGGKNVYPEEIEQKFAGLNDVLEVLVLGRQSKDGHSGEEVIAVCVPAYDSIEARHPGRSGDSDFVNSLIRAAIHAVNKQLPQYMKIVDYHVRESEFEKTSSVKIRRFLYSNYAKPKTAAKPASRS